MSTIRVRRLDENWDPVYGNGKGDYLLDGDAVAQIIQTRLRLWLEEWWENQDLGLPMMQKILGQRISEKLKIDRLISKEILRDPDIGITGIESFVSEFNSSTREYECTVYVNTIYGTVLVSNTSGG